MSTSSNGEWKFAPVESVINMINSLNDLTPFPWWTTLSLTAFSLRLFLFPLTIKQVRFDLPTCSYSFGGSQIQSSSSNFRLAKQAWQIAQSQSDGKQPDLNTVITKFQKLRKYSGASHPTWIIAAPFIQIPSFIVFVVAVRRMCADGWPGLSTGGALWFTDLTQHTVSFLTLQTYLGPSGVILPVAITLSYLLNLELSFRQGRIGGNVSGSVGDTITKLLRFGLEWLAVPTLLITLQLPQGTLVYWLTSSWCSIGQNVLLGNSVIRERLKLPKQGDSNVDMTSKFKPEVMDLFLKAAENRAAGKLPEALDSLKKIVLMDGENPRAHYAKGQLHGELKEWDAAIRSYQLAYDHEPESKMKAKCLLGMGISQFMKGNIRASERSLLSSLETNNKDIATLMALCSLYKNTGQKARAKEIIDYAVEIDSRCKQWEKHL